MKRALLLIHIPPPWGQGFSAHIVRTTSQPPRRGDALYARTIDLWSNRPKRRYTEVQESIPS